MGGSTHERTKAGTETADENESCDAAPLAIKASKDDRQQSYPSC